MSYGAVKVCDGGRLEKKWRRQKDATASRYAGLKNSWASSKGRNRPRQLPPPLTLPEAPEQKMTDTLVYTHHMPHHCTSESQACIRSMATALFEGLGEAERVQAELVVVGESAHEYVLRINRCFCMARNWTNNPQWEVEVEYTIPHLYTIPHGFGSAQVYGTRSSRVTCQRLELQASCADGKGWAVIRRLLEEPVGDTEYGCSRQSFTWVKVMKVKRFCYESATSSFVYKLVSQWEGPTEVLAKQNGVTFKIFLETGDSNKMKAEPQRSVVSMIAKGIDIIGRGHVQPVTVRDCTNLFVPPC